MRIVSRGLSYTYNKGAKFQTLALDSASLTVETGEFFGIIGRTGSGKSTFIQHLNALIAAQEAQELTVGEFDLLKNKKRRDRAKFKTLRKRVGMVFQYPEYQLFAESVFDDVAFGLKNFCPELTAAEVQNKVRAALETVGLNYFEVKDKSPFDLSGGQKRRVAIAGVIVSEPEVLVLDEPVAGLDPQGKKELWELLHRLNEGNRTIIVVSHDMNDVSEHCGRVAVFADGRVIASGTPREIFSDAEAIERAGLDVPVTARLAARLKAVGVDLDTDFTAEDFSRKVAAAYRAKKAKKGD